MLIIIDSQSVEVILAVSFKSKAHQKKQICLIKFLGSLKKQSNYNNRNKKAESSWQHLLLLRINVIDGTRLTILDGVHCELVMMIETGFCGSGISQNFHELQGSYN